MKTIFLFLILTTLTLAQSELLTLLGDRPIYQSSVAIPNFSFETFTGTADDGNTDTFTSWTNGAIGTGKIEAVTDAYDGSYAVKITTGDANNQNIYWDACDVPIDPNSDYTLSVWVKGTGTGACPAIYYWTNSGYSTTPDYSSVITSNWTQIKRDFSTGADDTLIAIYLRLWNDAGSIVYYDKVELKKKY